MEDWWTYLPALARRGKNQMATAGHDAEFAGVIAHADSSHTSYPRSLARCRPASPQFSGFSPRRFRVFHDTTRLKVPYCAR